MANSLKIVIGGDLFPSPQNVDAFAQGRVEELFDAEILRMFESADYTICNLEGALTDSAQKREKLGASLRAPYACVEAYRRLGVDCLTLANNHFTDYGQRGCEDTQRALQEANIAYVGAGLNADAINKSHSVELKDKKIAIYNVAETVFNIATDTECGVNRYDEYQVCRDIAELKKTHDYVIVIYHGGVEYFPYPTVELKKRFHRMADNGADLITAQHTHCIGCEEFYNGAYLLYGQGNFLFAPQAESVTKKGLLLILNITDAGEIYVEKIPVEKDEQAHEHVADLSLNEFDERSKKLHDDAFLQSEFQRFAVSRYTQVTRDLLRYNTFYRLAKKCLPAKWFSKLSPVKVDRKFYLAVLHMLRAEQRNQTMQGIVQHYLMSNEQK